MVELESVGRFSSLCVRHHAREGHSEMGDRFFRNQMADSAGEAPVSDSDTAKDPLSPVELLSLPYAALSPRFIQTALHLKQTVVEKTWSLTERLPQDYTLYTGLLGTAFLAFKSYLLSKNGNDLKLCSDIVRACHSVSADSGRVSFLCGRAGVCALGAVAAKLANDGRLVDHYLGSFKDIKLPSELPNELLYGRAGFLWACLFLNKHVGQNTISNTIMRSVVDEIMEAGRQLGRKGKSPLMYEWHRKKYWGAAHGVAGIMHVLMNMELKPDEVEDVKNTLLYMVKNRFPSGNFRSSEGNDSDRLVHWCHGAPGVALTLIKAAEVFGVDEFLQAALEAGEVIWNRGLLKRVGICHGISGNTYVFLSLYRLTGDIIHLYRAKAFACFLHQNAEKLISEGKIHSGDRPYSLFEGIGGMAYPPNQPTPMPETLSSSMPMQQMSFASIPQPGSSRMDPVPYGYAAASGGSAPQQPPVKNAYGPAAGEGYMPPGQQPALSSGGGYMMYDRESGRPSHPPSQQPHFNQGGYPPANAPHQPQATTGPHGSARNPSHSHLIEKLVGMGFRGDHVATVIQRMEDSGQPVDFNGVLDRLSSASPGPGPQRAW